MKKSIIVLIMILSCMSLFSQVYTETYVDSLLKSDPNTLLLKSQELIGQAKYSEAINYYLAYWETNRTDQTTLYNIACLYGLTGKPSLACSFLNKAVDQGMNDYDAIARDKDFDKIKADTLFIQTLSKIREKLSKEESVYGNIDYVKTEVKVKYRILLPKNYDPKKKYTLLVGLHGYGGSNKSFIRLGQNLVNEDIIFVCPQAPYPFESGSGKFSGFSWTVYDYEEQINHDHSSELSSDFVMTVISDVKKKHQIKSVFLTGFSQGGFMTLGISLYNPKFFDGAICIGGGLREDWIGPAQRKKAKKLPVLLIHGMQDNVVPFKNAQQAYDVLSKEGYQVTLNSFSGAHTVPKDEFLKAVEWIKAINKSKGIK